MFRQKVTLFFLLVLIGNYARGGGGPSTKFYCWHVLTYFYKKIFRRELVISFCPVGTSVFSIMAVLGGGSGCRGGQVYVKQVGGECGQLASADDHLVCSVHLRGSQVLFQEYATSLLNGCCHGGMIFWAREPLNCSNILRASFWSVGFYTPNYTP